MTRASYPGTELELFMSAVNWKRYCARCLAPSIRGDVLEVGAGLGANALWLARAASFDSWLCIEPDATLFRCLEHNLRECPATRDCRAREGTIEDLPSEESFDSIVYIDVLEHIADDDGELRRAAARLRPGGTVASISPAGPSLYSPWDRALGHHRRYDPSRIEAITPPGCRVVRARYIDAAGFFASFANRLLLRQSGISKKQVEFWDRFLVPVSQRMDPVTGRFFGKSIVAVWGKESGGEGPGSAPSRAR